MNTDLRMPMGGGRLSRRHFASRCRFSALVRSLRPVTSSPARIPVYSVRARS
jgi:hypothetical protein